MSDNTVFDRLVNELSSEERQEMLLKMREDMYVPEVVLPEEDDQEKGIEALYGNPGFLERLLLFLVALFSGRSRQEVRETMMFRRASRDLERAYPGIVDFQQGVLLENFLTALENISLAFSVFVDPLQQINGVTKEEFYAFLGGFEMPDLQAELKESLQPLSVEASSESEDVSMLKREIEFKIEDLLSTIEREEHDRMYLNARQVAWLRTAAFYPYRAILSECEKPPNGPGRVCYISKVINHLAELADLVVSYPAVPAQTLFQALITYRYREDITKEDFHYEDRLKDFVDQAVNALEQFASFARGVPLIRIIRLFRRNVSYYPRRSTGGEDWLLYFRQFWLKKLSENYQSLMVHREVCGLVGKAATFIKQKNLPPNGLYRSNAWGYELKVKYEKSYSFLTGFYRNIFLPEMNPVLKVVLIDGQFYKEQNREDFTEAYNQVVRLAEEIVSYTSVLSKTGEKGSLIEAVENELISPPQRARKIAGILEVVDRELGTMIGQTLQNLDQMEKVLKGIVYGEKGGRYDTLSNIGYLGKRGNASFIVQLSGVHKKAETAIEILKSLLEIESSGAPGSA